MEPLRAISLVGLLITLVMGWYLRKNYHRLFGVDPNSPSETSGQRLYSSTQIFSVWLFCVGLFVLMFLVA